MYIYIPLPFTFKKCQSVKTRCQTNLFAGVCRIQFWLPSKSSHFGARSLATFWAIDHSIEGGTIDFPAAKRREWMGMDGNGGMG